MKYIILELLPTIFRLGSWNCIVSFVVPSVYMLHALGSPLLFYFTAAFYSRPHSFLSCAIATLITTTLSSTVLSVSEAHVLIAILNLTIAVDYFQ